MKEKNSRKLKRMEIIDIFFNKIFISKNIEYLDNVPRKMRRKVLSQARKKWLNWRSLKPNSTTVC